MTRTHKKIQQQTRRAQDFVRIAKALTVLVDKRKEQPRLDELARALGVSEFYFQRMFTQWTGVSPKKFLQYLSLEHAKKLLKDRSSLLETSFSVGLSGSGRLHDLFVTIEGMTPGEYKNGGKGLTIHYSVSSCMFGNYLVASTYKGICTIFFYDSYETQEAYTELKRMWPKATLISERVDLHFPVTVFFDQITNNSKNRNSLRSFSQKVKLHLKGTSFQLKVWEALLKIPEGSLVSYSSLSSYIGKTKARRAVGTAIGNNPIAFLIPCHRVIKSVGEIGEYRWGRLRKLAMVGVELARTKKVLRNVGK